MSDCTDKWAHDALDRLFVGDIEGPEFERLQKHAASCQSCSSQYDRISRADGKLSRTDALSPGRLALLQRGVLDRAELKNEQERAAKGERRWWMPALGFAMAAAVAVGIAYVPKTDDGQYQARGNNTNAAFGIRAFCVRGPKVIAEALPGGTLKCAPGNSLQLTYTAPKASTLRVDVGSNSMLSPRAVVSGADVPLDFSTPVTTEWLNGPTPVTATFDVDGKPAQSTVIVAP